MSQPYGMEVVQIRAVYDALIKFFSKPDLTARCVVIAQEGDRAIARTEWPALSASFTVSGPIPLLAPMIRAVLIGSMLQLEVPELGLLLMANFRNGRVLNR
jgi:hypothetical protein